MPEPVPLVAPAFVKDEPMFCFIDRTPEPVLWQHSEQITIGFHDGVPHQHVETLVKEAIEAWNSRLAPSDSVLTPKLVFSTSSPVKVRLKFCPVSFQRLTGFANTSHIGPGCLAIATDSTACLAIKGDDKDPTATERIYSQDYIYRGALHLLGHILGLPHARRPASHPGFKADLLGDFSYTSVIWTKNRDASGFINDAGYAGLSSPSSIMHFDVPSELSGNGKELRCGGGPVIDDESVALLRRLYTLAPIFTADHAEGDYGWSNGERSRSSIKTPPSPSRIVSGISRIEFGTHDNIRVDVIPQHSGSGTPFDARIRTWASTHLAYCRAQYLGIPRSKPKVETGDLWCGNISNSRFERSITFAESYKNPVVMVSLNLIDFSNQNWLRIETRAENVTSTGCKIIAETWAGSPAYGVNVCWLVHEASDPQIRSGRFCGWGDGRLNPPSWWRSLEGRHNFSVPMLRSPRHVWTGLCHANARHGVNIRLESEVTGWDQNGVNWRLSTWHDESKFHALDAVFVAIL